MVDVRDGGHGRMPPPVKYATGPTPTSIRACPYSLMNPSFQNSGSARLPLLSDTSIGWVCCCRTSPWRTSRLYRPYTGDDQVCVRTLYMQTRVQNNLAKGRIAVLSPLASANWFVRFILPSVASVTRQYNLVPAKGRWRSTAGNVTTGLAEKSNGSLPPGGEWCNPGVHADWLYTGIRSGPNAR